MMQEEGEEPTFEIPTTLPDAAPSNTGGSWSGDPVHVDPQSRPPVTDASPAAPIDPPPGAAATKPTSPLGTMATDPVPSPGSGGFAPIKDKMKADASEGQAQVVASAAQFKTGFQTSLGRAQEQAGQIGSAAQESVQTHSAAGASLWQTQQQRASEGFGQAQQRATEGFGQAKQRATESLGQAQQQVAGGLSEVQQSVQRGADDPDMQRKIDELKSDLAAAREEAKQAKWDIERLQKELVNVRPPDPNFPRHCMCIKPQVYHNIEAELSQTPDRKPYLKKMYANYYITCGLLVLQCIAALIGFCSPDKEDKEASLGSHFGFSIVYLIGIPGAFVVWYWPLYVALTQRNVMRYRMCHVGIFFAGAYAAYMAVGVVGHGGSGIFFSMEVFDNKDSEFAGILALIVAGMWILEVPFLLWAYCRMRRYFDEDKNTTMGRIQEAGHQAVMAGATASLGGGGAKAKK